MVNLGAGALFVLFKGVAKSRCQNCSCRLKWNNFRGDHKAAWDIYPENPNSTISFSNALILCNKCRPRLRKKGRPRTVKVAM